VTCTAFKCVGLIRDPPPNRPLTSARLALAPYYTFATQTWRLKAIEVNRPTLLESAQIIGRVRILFGQYIDIADFDVGWLHPRPFGACTQKPVALSDDTRRMKRINLE
jgi:hypothetical protein